MEARTTRPSAWASVRIAPLGTDFDGQGRSFTCEDVTVSAMFMLTAATTMVSVSCPRDTSFRTLYTSVLASRPTTAATTRTRMRRRGIALSPLLVAHAGRLREDQRLRQYPNVGKHTVEVHRDGHGHLRIAHARVLTAARSGAEPSPDGRENRGQSRVAGCGHVGRSGDDARPSGLAGRAGEQIERHPCAASSTPMKITKSRIGRMSTNSRLATPRSS